METEARDTSTGRPSNLGVFLREARLSKGLELSDVAASTHVRRDYLSALEEGRYDALPEDIYARNFVRLYAQTVGVSSERALELFAAERRRSAPDAPAPKPAPSRRAPKPVRPAPATLTPTDAAPTRFSTTRSSATRSSTSRSAAAPATSLDSGAASHDAHTPDAHTPDALSTPVPVGRTVTLASSRAASAGRPRRPVRLGAWLPTLLLIAAVVALGLWAFNALLFSPRATTADALPTDVTPTGTLQAEPPASGATPLPTAPSATTPLTSVGLTLETTPPGADVSIDGFSLASTTPISGYPVTPGAGRTLRVTLPGYLPHEQALDLLSDTALSVALVPEGDAATDTPTPDETGTEAPPAPSAGQVTVRIEENTWLEAYASTQRGVGERLVYTTVNAGQSFSFPLPVYLHVGNAAGVRVWVGEQDRGLMGSSGEVVSRAFTQ